MTDAATLPYRPNVGAIIMNREGKVFLARRADLSRGPTDPGVWQFPQGGIDEGETPETALFRELAEEIGTNAIQIIARHPEWLSYDLPPHLIGRALGGRFRGQTQAWFVVRFTGNDVDINLNAHLPAEFEDWSWIDLDAIQTYNLGFKRDLYTRLARDFETAITPETP